MKWEYTQVIESTRNPMAIDDIDRLGRRGWELCCVAPVGERKLLYILKRPIKSEGNDLQIKE